MKTQTPNILVGIDIGTYHIKVVVANILEDKEEKELEVIGSGYSQSRGLRNGYIVELEEAIESIREAILMAENSSNVKIKKAYVGIGGIGLKSKIKRASINLAKKDTVIAKAHIKKVFEICEKKMKLSRNYRILHSIPVFYTIDREVISKDPTGMRCSKLGVKALFINGLYDHLEDIIIALREIGIEVDDILATPIVASITTLTKEERNAGCALALIGSETLSVVVFEHDVPISLEVFPMGYLKITKDIARSLKISKKTAEQLKIGKTSRVPYSEAKINTIIRNSLLDIFKIINNHIKKSGYEGVLWAGIVLTGGGSVIPHLDRLARLHLKLPARVTKPYFPGNSLGLGDSAWIVAYGLCLVWMKDSLLEKNS